jgi:hypothetical protein
MIEWLMLFALGFLVASLLALAIIPLVHARATRLAARRILVDIPISMAEIHADRDSLRAEFAVSSRRLEVRIEQLTARMAKQQAELGRKSDEVNRLKIALAASGAEIPAREAVDPELRGEPHEAEAGTHAAAGPPDRRSLHDRLAELAEHNPDLASSPLVPPGGNAPVSPTPSMNGTRFPPAPG